MGKENVLYLDSVYHLIEYGVNLVRKSELSKQSSSDEQLHSDKQSSKVKFAKPSLSFLTRQPRKPSFHIENFGSQLERMPVVQDKITTEGKLSKAVFLNGEYARMKDGIIHSYDDLPAKHQLSLGGSSTFLWYDEGEIHRDGDKPARISESGIWEWRKRGRTHRDGDKPALIGLPPGKGTWYKDGRICREGNKPVIQTIVEANEETSTC